MDDNVYIFLLITPVTLLSIPDLTPISPNLIIFTPTRSGVSYVAITFAS